MAIQLGSATGKVIIDGSGVQKGIGDAQGALEGFKTKMQNIGTQMQTIGTQMSLALTLPILAAGRGMIDAASHFEETKNKVGEIFGEMNDDMLAWSQNASTTMGMSQQSALDAASDMGIFGKAAGLAGDDLSDFAKSNTQLATDLGSFFDTSPEEAITAIGAAYRGESEPIRKYGVLIDQAAVKQKAMELGLINAGDELTQQNRILAVNALIQDQTASAQGDFVRTSDSLANQQRSLQGKLHDTAVTMGQQLLPFAKQVVSIIMQLVERFQNLSPEMQKTILIVLAIVAAIGPLLMILGSVVTAIGVIAPIIGAIGSALAPIALPIIAIIALIALLYLAWKNNLGGIQEKTAAVIAALKNWWESVLLPALQKVWAWMKTVLFPYWKALANFLSAVFGVALKILAGIWQNVLWPAIKGVINWMKVNVMPVLKPIADFLRNVFARAFTYVTDAIRGVTDWLTTMTDKLNNITLPDWMNPGSPTPWELGLRGVSAQLRAISRARLPELAIGMNRLPLPAYAAMAGANAANSQQAWNQRVMIYNANFQSTKDMRAGNWLDALKA